MANDVTVASMIERARRRADLTNTRFVTDATLLVELNDYLRELHEILADAYDDYSLSEHDITTAANTRGYALPEDLYTVKGVDQLSGGDWVPLKRYEFDDRHNRQNVGGSGVYRYRLQAAQLYLDRNPAAGVSIKIWYVPKYTDLTSGQSYDDYNGWSKLPVVRLAAFIREMQDLDSTPQLREAARLEERVRAASRNRDTGEAPKIRNVRNNFRGDYYEADFPY